MDNKIRNYQELKREEERLLELLKIQKMRLQADLSELKKEAKPVIDVFSIAGKLTSRNNDNILVNTLADLLIARMFSKSNLLVWLIFPTLLSNLSSHYTPKLVAVVQDLIRKRLKTKSDDQHPDSADFIPVMLSRENGHKEHKEEVIL